MYIVLAYTALLLTDNFSYITLSCFYILHFLVLVKFLALHVITWSFPVLLKPTDLVKLFHVLLIFLLLSLGHTKHMFYL